MLMMEGGKMRHVGMFAVISHPHDSGHFTRLPHMERRNFSTIDERFAIQGARLWETFPFHSLRATLKVPQCRHYKNFLHRPPTLELLPSEAHNDYFLIYACLQITRHSGHCSPSRNDRTVKIYLEWIISRRFSPTFGFMLRFFHFTNIFTRKGFRQCVNVSPLGNFCSVGASTTIPDTQCRWFKMPSGFSKYRRFCTIDRALSPISRFLLPFHQSDWTLRNFNDC